MDTYNKEFFQERLETIGELSQNLSSTIDDFGNFYHSNNELSTTTLREVVDKAVSLINNSLQSNHIEMFYEHKDIEKISLYENEIVQVIINILKNSLDNFKEKKVLNPQIKITTQSNSITIFDNGGGIAQNIIEDIFNPYFSTKDEKNGKGLGLYVSKSIVENHHKGSLLVNNYDDGVYFRIILSEVMS